MSQTPAARQRNILELLDARQILTVQELATELGVSAMTVHRDLNKLASSGRLVKTHGGVALPSQAQAGNGAPVACAMCRRPVPERSAVIMQSPRLGRMTACCPHCGLTLLERGTSADLMLVTDFLNCHVISANDATYLVGSDVESCCRPVILAFAGVDAAERFQRGFGGEIMSLAQVRHHLHHGMCVSCEGPSHGTRA
jgi:DeoR family transcriptional regulator, copper-sensing transcriptional repressor